MMKNVFARIMICVLTVFLTVGLTAVATAAETADTSWYDASATSYTLTDEADLLGLFSLVNDRVNLYGKTVFLGDDLTLGTSGTCTGNFNGILDGQGHTITVLAGTNGLFGSMNGATVKNLTLNVSITGEDENLGALAASSTGCTVENVTLKGTVSGKVAVGGLIGKLTGKMNVNGFSTSAEISGSEMIGGMIGNASFASTSGYLNVQNVTIGGKLSGASLYAGGIAGYAYNAVTVSGGTVSPQIQSYNYVGGLVGMLGSTDENTGEVVTSGVLTAEGLQVTANINAQGGVGYAGGLVGRAVGDLSVTDTTVQGTLNGIGTGFGGVAGGVEFGTLMVNKVFVNVGVQGGRSVGGLCGAVSGSAVITDTAVCGTVSANTTHAAGLIGANSAGLDIARVYVDAQIQAYKAATGFVGESACTSAVITLSVSDSVFAGEVTCENATGASAMLGTVQNDANIAMTRCFSVGKVGTGAENEKSMNVLLLTNSKGTVSVTDCYLLSALSEQIGSGNRMPELIEGTNYITVQIADVKGTNATAGMSRLDFNGVWSLTDSYPIPTSAASLGVSAKAFPSDGSETVADDTHGDTQSSGGCGSAVLGGLWLTVLAAGAVVLGTKKRSRF